MKFSLALFLVFAVGAQAQTLATVGANKITVEEFNKRLEDIRNQAANPPTPEQFLEDLVRFEVGVQEAEKMKLANDPLVRERFRQVLYNSLLEKQLSEKINAVQITEKEMKEFYNKNPEIHLAHILIDMRADAKPEERELTRKRALEILEEVRKSKRPFEELVKLYSDDIPTKESGGDIGFQTRVTLIPSVYDAAAKMKVNEIKGLIETRSGFHILKVLERKTYDQADKRPIRAALFDEKRAKIFNNYFEQAKKSYKIEVSKEVLKTIK